MEAQSANMWKKGWQKGKGRNTNNFERKPDNAQMEF